MDQDEDGWPISTEIGCPIFATVPSSLRWVIAPSAIRLPVPNNLNDPYNKWNIERFKYAISPAVSSFHITGSLTWHPNGELSQMAYTDTSDSTKNQTCTYSSDDLSRIASVNCGSNVWAQTFSYDAFGNINKTGNPGISYQPGAYNPVTNQISPGAPFIK